MAKQQKITITYYKVEENVLKKQLLYKKIDARVFVSTYKIKRTITIEDYQGATREITVYKTCPLNLIQFSNEIKDLQNQGYQVSVSIKEIEALNMKSMKMVM